MLKKHKQKTINVAIFILAFFFAFITEYVISHFNEIKGTDYVMEIGDATQSNTKFFKEFSFDLKNKTVSSISIKYTSSEDFSYTISCVYKNVDKEVSDNAYASINYAATKINKVCSNLKVKIPKDVSISGIEITNRALFSVPRFLFIFGIVFILSFILLNIRYGIKMEAVFVILCLVFGLTIIFVEGPELLAWDEQIHFANAWDMSYMSYSENSKASILYEELKYPKTNTLEEKIYVSQWLNSIDDCIKSESKDFYISYDKLVYLPQSIRILISIKTGLGFGAGFYIGKITNLLFYILIFSFGIKNCNLTKYILFVIGLQPTSVFLAASYSYDPFVISLVSVGMAFLFEEFICDSKVNANRSIIGLICVVVGTLSKRIYIPLLAIVFLYNSKKFKSKKQRVVFNIIILMIILVVMSTFVAPTLGSAINGTVIAGDARGGATSVSEQLLFIINNPFEYARILFTSWGKTIFSYLFGTEINVNFAYYTILKNVILADIVYVILFWSTALTANSYIGKNITHKIKIYKVFTVIMVLGVMYLIWTALYLSFTPVGLGHINGVQARYYIPLLLLIATLCLNNKIKFKKSQEYYNVIITIGMIVVWLFVLICII